jgi:O-antigen ligase
MESVARQDRLGAAIALGFAILAGLFAVAVAAPLSQTGAKWKIVVLFALAFPAIAVAWGRLRELLVFFWIVSLTYNRQFFSFNGIFGDNGTQGPYWVLGDVFLAALLILWIYESAILKRRFRAEGNAVWPWFLPFVLACVLSIPGAQRPDWSLFEMIRLAKFALILAYVRKCFGPREWWAAIAALAFSLVLQSLIGLKEVITGHPGVFGTAVTQGVAGFEDVFNPESFYGWVRATGTMNHPPNLACYMIFVIPVCLGIALTARKPLLRILAAIFFLVGCAGLACTLSRWPWMLAAGEIVLCFGLLTALRMIRFSQAVGILAVSTFILGVCLLPFRQKILDRETRDLQESVDQRREGVRVALALASESPIFGIGINNSKLYVAKYVPDLEWTVENEDLLVQTNIRSIAAMGNGFLFVTAETGAVGSVAFAIFVLGMLLISIRAIHGTEGMVRGACIGLALGLLGVLLQDLIDFSLWVDPLLYTVAIVLAMLNLAPAVFPKERTN